jgi:hypothetical protein
VIGPRLKSFSTISAFFPPATTSDCIFYCSCIVTVTVVLLKHSPTTQCQSVHGHKVMVNSPRWSIFHTLLQYFRDFDNLVMILFAILQKGMMEHYQLGQWLRQRYIQGQPYRLLNSTYKRTEVIKTQQPFIHQWTCFLSSDSDQQHRLWPYADECLFQPCWILPSARFPRVEERSLVAADSSAYKTSWDGPCEFMPLNFF